MSTSQAAPVPAAILPAVTLALLVLVVAIGTLRAQLGDPLTCSPARLMAIY